MSYLLCVVTDLFTTWLEILSPVYMAKQHWNPVEWLGDGYLKECKRF